LPRQEGAAGTAGSSSTSRGAGTRRSGPRSGATSATSRASVTARSSSRSGSRPPGPVEALLPSLVRGRARSPDGLGAPPAEGMPPLDDRRGGSPRNHPWIRARARKRQAIELHRHPKDAALPSGREARVVLCDPAWWPDGAEPGPKGDRRPGEPDGAARRSAAEDLYALGGVFYAMLTKRPFRATAGTFPRPRPASIPRSRSTSSAP